MGLFKSFKKIFKGIGKAISGIVKAVVGVVKSLIDFVLQPFMAPDVPGADEANRQQGVLVQKQGSNVSIPVVYGMRRVGGIVTFAETGSTNNQYLWVAYVLSEGKVEGLKELYIDDYQIDRKYIDQAMSAEGQLVAIGDGKYKDRVQFQFFPGTFYDEGDIGNSVLPDRTLMASENWKDTMYYNGLAVLFVRYYWKKIESQADSDNNPFSGNIPQIKATILGRKVQTLITGSDWSTYSTNERYSTNPAECLADYLRNPRYGKGLVNADLDWTSFQKAAIKCNQEVEYVTDTFGPIVTCNAVIDSGQTLMNNVKYLLSNMRSYMPFVQGKYKLKVEDAGDPDDILSGVATIAATFTPDNIQGNVTFTGIPRNAKYNAVAVTYVDPDNKYSTQQVVYPETEAERQTYIDLDGGRENKQEVTFAHITNYAMAKDFARMLFNKSRQQETCSLRVSSQALELEPGDNIRIQSNILDFDDDPWRIVSLKYNDDTTIDLACVRNPDTIYPHTRVGEEDDVLPVYIPKGATIYYPTSQNDKRIGLIPPTHAPGYNETDPNTSAGGGVGDPNGSINGGDNNEPSVEVPLDLIDTASVYNIKFSTISGPFLKGTFQFVQPEHAMYAGIDFYYKLESETGYRKLEINTQTGAGQIVEFQIDNLISQQRYLATTRVRYDTGEYSQKVSNFLFVPTGYPNFAFTPKDTIDLVSSGWKLPDYEQIEVTNNAPAYILVPVAASVGGERRLTVKVQERIAVEAPNPNIQGMKIYWKPSNTLYWNEDTFLFQQDYKSGEYGEFTFDGDIGSDGDAQVEYDFIFRYSYKGNPPKESTIQSRFMAVDVTSTNFDNYSILLSGDPDQRFGLEDIGDYTFQVKTNDAVISDPRDLEMPIVYAVVEPGFGNDTITTFGMDQNIVAQNDAYLTGYRVYMRRYDPFLYPNTWQEATRVDDVYDANGNVQIQVTTNNEYEYEFAIVPLVDDSGTELEAYNCYYLRGYPVFFQASNLPSTDPKIPNITTDQYDGVARVNFKQLWNATLKDLGDVIASKQKKQIAGDFVPDIKDFYVRGYFGSSPWGSVSGTNFLYAGYVVKFDWEGIGATYAGMRVYRRQRVAYLLNDGKDNQYYGLGRWEYFDFLDTYGTVGTNNDLKAMRAPISIHEYTPQGIDNTYWSGVPFGVPTVDDEFIFVVLEDDGGGVTESTKGIYMKGGNWSSVNSVINITSQPQTVVLSDYDLGVDTDRQISNAVAAYSLSQMTAMSQFNYPWGSGPINANTNLTGVTQGSTWPYGTVK